MGEEKKDASIALGRIDKELDKLSSYLNDRISTFVAFMFILIAAGSFYGYVIIPHFQSIAIYFLMAPIVLALVSYFNRTFASIMFVGLLFIIFLF